MTPEWPDRIAKWLEDQWFCCVFDHDLNYHTVKYGRNRMRTKNRTNKQLKENARCEPERPDRKAKLLENDWFS